jgi:hypothetical protein
MVNSRQALAWSRDGYRLLWAEDGGVSRSQGGGAGEKCGCGWFLEMLVCRLRVDRGIESAGAQSLVLQASPQRARERERERGGGGGGGRESELECVLV